jgi:hypothetical protein
MVDRPTAGFGVHSMTIERIGQVTIRQIGGLFAAVNREDQTIEWFKTLEDAHNHAIETVDLVDGLYAIVH